MAVDITDVCIGCGACFEECPNEAVVEVDGLYIVIPDRCTECWGIYSSAQCLDLCPVEAVALDRDHPDDEASLERKFRRLHPGLDPRLTDMWRKPA